ncbi:hypothetical protein [Deinococcus hohokamensis]|uniref:GGDEF domain-containing protein n=1 Tax=Deinococcus hohokamensis TaxID=309883 RepID=A0ABV9I7S4_9DEIO
MVLVSVNVTVAPDDGQDTLTLMAYADAAMYRAKERKNSGDSYQDARAG